MTDSPMKQSDTEFSLSLPADPRSSSRQLAMQFLYQLDVQKGESLRSLDSFLQEYGKEDGIRERAKEWIQATWRNQKPIDELIQSVSSNWELHRISTTDRSNLRLAVYQLLHCPDIPAKVVINEAVELAKRFSTAQAPGFINGVLDALQKKIRADLS